jgi:hypothetical protein
MKYQLFGSVVFGITASEVALGLISVEEELQTWLPIVSPVALSTRLSDPTDAPLHTRLSLTNEQYSLLIARIVRLFEWNKILAVEQEADELLDLSDQISKSIK